MPDIWRSLKTKLLDEGGIEDIFSHVRNLLIATVIIAAGFYATRQQPNIDVLGILNLEIAGFGVAAIGFILVGLNLFDGLNKLTRLGTPLVLKVTVVGLYLLVSMRLVQLTVLLRAG
jgi:hypothetical protein